MVLLYKTILCDLRQEVIIFHYCIALTLKCVGYRLKSIRIESRNVVKSRVGHSGRPTQPYFFHPESGWARFVSARPVCKN